MAKIVVFGAGGRAGRRTLAEARDRGHQVTAVVRDPARYADLSAGGVDVVAGDVTRTDRVAEVAAGHDVAIHTAARLDVPAQEFFVSAARALLDGLSRAGVARLLLVGIGTTLWNAAGVRLHDAPDFPAEHRLFSLGHAAELDVLRATATEIDWLVVTPPPVFLDDEAPRTGRYRLGGIQVLTNENGEPSGLSYADLAVALLDEIDTPKHHRTQIAVAA
jgi:hypothetical protein